MHSTWSNWPGPRRKPVAPKQEQTGLGSGKRSWNTSYTAPQFFAGSTRDTLILSALAIDVPAFSRLSFIISSASPNCWRASPGPSGRRSGYQPPMPPTNARFPERMGPPTRCLPGLEDAPWAAMFGENTCPDAARQGCATWMMSAGTDLPTRHLTSPVHDSFTMCLDSATRLTHGRHVRMKPWTPWKPWEDL